jgi:hypothetical protein
MPNTLPADQYATTWSLTIDVKFSKTRETGYVAADICVADN